MPASSQPATARPAWRTDSAARRAEARASICARCSRRTPTRGEGLTVEAAGLLLDYSKNRVTDETIRLLVQLAEESKLRAWIDAMFRGDKINITENRAVLHVALRAPRGAAILVDGENVVPKVHAVLDKMAALRRARAQRRLERPHR